MSLDLFHPIVRQWFAQRFGEPTEPQRLGWPHIAANTHTLIAAPTGSGKTLSAFLVCLDRLLRQWLAGALSDSIHVVYVSPLKALSNDIERNLQTPLGEIATLVEAAGHGTLGIRVGVRTGDTPTGQRQQMLRLPPHILVTTPESLYLMLTSEKTRKLLRTVRTVIVDEIHALARDKRGSHLTLSLERLAALCESPPTRIGLSATQRPMDEIAKFLVGHVSGNHNRDRAEHDGSSHSSSEPPAACQIVDVGHVRNLDLAIEVPPSDLAAVCSNEQWAEVYEQLVERINSHRSTLIFVNTRRAAERIAHRLTERLGEEAVASHHGSLSREIRLSAEQRLKAGKLKAIVATASLEMGIDIGYIDLVCQIGSPRAIATFLQRVGRSGHSLGATPKGRLFPLTRDELLECMALVRAVKERTLDRIEIPDAPLDILAQQIVAAVACEEWDERELYELCRRAYPYRDLTPEAFNEVVAMVSEGLSPKSKRGAYLHRDQIHRRLRARRGARLAAITSGGAIPETAQYRVLTDNDGTFVGSVDEDFAIESMAGDIFLLGNTSWRIRAIRGGEVIVSDAEGAPPSIPFWFGEAPGRTVELSAEISRLRSDIAARLGHESAPGAQPWLHEACGVDAGIAGQAVRYVAAQVAALGLVPTQEKIVFERFFDESGGMQLVIHAPLGARINRAWGLALRKRFCRSFDFELQAAATDNGILLSLSPQHSFPIEQLFKMLGPHNGEHLLKQAVLAVPMFQVRWRWNVTRSLAILRSQHGKKVPFFLQRFRSDDLLAAVFPETVGCLENHHGDVEIPNHPLVRQTMRDCLTEAMDVTRWLNVLADAQTGVVELIPRDTREPSPFSHELINANPYAFLDGAPLEERRTRAVSTRRSLDPEDFRDLTKLDSVAVEQVRRDAWPLVRDAEELHDTLQTMVTLDPRDAETTWQPWFEQLCREGRAALMTVSQPAGTATFWIAAERWPLLRAVYEHAAAQPAIQLPPELDVSPENKSDGWLELVRGRVQFAGPIAVRQLARQLLLDESFVRTALEALEAQGLVLRGEYLENETVGRADNVEPDWCDRRLLARIHRLTLDGLRKRIQPVSIHDFLRFLVKHQRLSAENHWSGPLGVREAIAQLQGFEMPAGAWEHAVLAARVADYDSQWLDQLFLAGEAMWGRLRPPRRDESDGPSMAALTRVVPISLLLREDLPQLLPDDRPDVANLARANAAAVLTALNSRGALFLSELKLLTGLLATQLEEALRELAALGLVTSDAFAAVRSIVEDSGKSKVSQRRRRRTFSTAASPAGRWSLFPGLAQDSAGLRAAPSRLVAEPQVNQKTVLALQREQRLEFWCRLLLRRYGLIFRDLLARESAAPSWFELVPTLRRLELRGEVRGGRFVAGVSGEQYGLEATVSQLRQIRDAEALADSGANARGGVAAASSPTDWLVISAADPLNLSGIVDDGPRVPAQHQNRLILLGGRCVATKRGAEIEFQAEFDEPTRQAMRRALLVGERREPVAHITAARLAKKRGAM